MKMFMIIADGSLRDQVEVFLEDHGARGYTEVPMVFGEGTHGKRLGSRLHPGASTLIFTVVPAERAVALKTQLADMAARVNAAGTSMHVAVLGVEEFL
ncbi:MAG: hypothetical protein IT350_02885 [Deltaproteobacteria bacterium]|nr:hypothetical protein [Deltaproteobacteria bacterium]